MVDNLVISILSTSSIPIFSEKDLHAIVAEYGTSIPSNAPAFPISQGASHHSSVHSQVPVSAVGNTLQPMEEVISGDTQATLLLSLNITTATAPRTEVPHSKHA